MRVAKVVTWLVVGLAVCGAVLGWLRGSPAPVAGTEYYVGPQFEKLVSFVQERFGCSRADAVKFIHRAARENGARVIDRFELPEGAEVEFFSVDGSRGRDEVKLLGRARVVAANSPVGRLFWDMARRAAARRPELRRALRALADLRKKGIIFVPAWFGPLLTGNAATGAPKNAKATNYKVAVICARFPAWQDRSPWSDGDAERHDGDIYYEPDPNGELRNVDPAYDESHGWDFIDWYIDSPGGRLDPAGGVPLGTEVQWNDTHPSRDPAPYDDTTLELRDYWFRRMFDVNFMGSPAGQPSWAGSLRNYYWDNSHGNVTFYGERTDIYGWVESHHILDRRPYPQGPAPVYMVQPGTPIIRPSSEIIAQDGVDRPILRASITQDKITVLYKEEWRAPWAGNPGDPPMPVVMVYQRDTDGDTNGDQPGWVTLDMTKTTVVVDPYDHRRWTYINDGWEYHTAGSDPSETEDFDFEIWAGQPWSLSTTLDGGYTWQAGEVGYMPQDQGCGALPNTLFTSADVLGSAPGNRLKSFDYYCHDHFMDPDRGPYQIEHLYHGSYVDDIGGDSEPASARKPRAYPFDCGMPEALGGSDRMQFGFFHYPNNDNSSNAQHSAAQMRADVLDALADSGVTLGTYDRLVFVFAGSGVGEGGGGSVGNWGTIIAHAAGTVVTVSEDVTLTTMAHEIGHTLGMVDLYDNNFYDNALSGTPPNPQYFECNGLGPYSVMAHGVRVDAWHLVKLGWVPATPLQNDHPSAEIPAVEGVLRDPVIYKLPANPYYIVDGVSPSSWQEYFLVEYRYKTGQDWYGDQSPVGVYIYHVDERNIGGFQRSEPTLTVAMEQADGLFELENNLAHSMSDYPTASVGPGNLAGDPFPGSSNNRNFCQWDFNIEQWLAGNNAPDPVPTSYSHGQDDGAGHIVPGTDTDSFTRVLNIRLNGPVAYADIYVQPREIIVTGDTSCYPPDWDGDANPDPIWQGLQDVPILRLDLANPQHTAGSYEYMSTGPVTVQQIRIVESGTSLNDQDVKYAKLWEDNGDGTFDPNTDTRLAVATVQNQEAIFGGPDASTGLNLRIGANETKQLFVTYDVWEQAQVNPRITLGVDLPEPRYVWPEPPGTVQVRERRQNKWDFGEPRFPIQSGLAEVLDATDHLLISASDIAPTSVRPNDKNVPLLRMVLSVDHDRCIVRKLQFDCSPASGPANAQHDLDRLVLWQDVNENGAIDTAVDTQLAQAVFSSANTAYVDGLNLTVSAGSPVHLILACDVAKDATIGNWLQAQVTGPASVVLVDEDGAGDLWYEDPANPGTYDNDSHGGTWTLVAGADEVDGSSAPWKTKDIRIDYPQPPVLELAQTGSPPQDVPPVNPFSGPNSEVFTFTIRYRSTAGILPQYVRLHYRNLRWQQATAPSGVVVDMQEVDPSDTDVTDGKDYQVQITGFQQPAGENPGHDDWGAHRFYFEAADQYGQTVYFYLDANGNYQCTDTAPQPAQYGWGDPTNWMIDCQDWILGPVIGTASTIRFMDSTYTNEVTTAEEGDTLYIELQDPDENYDPNTAETIPQDYVTVAVQVPGGDVEHIQLTETGNNTGIFRGSLPTASIGSGTPTPDNGTLELEAGTGTTIIVEYRDRDDFRQADGAWMPGAIDTSTASLTIQDTTPPGNVTVNNAVVALKPAKDGWQLDVDWSGYAEPTDLVQYEIYVYNQAFGDADLASMTPALVVGPGTTSATVERYLDPNTATWVDITYKNQPLWVAVIASDEAGNKSQIPGGNAPSFETQDTTAPQVASQDPAPGDTGVALDKPIYFELTDDLAGIDPTTVTVQYQVNGGAWQDITSQMTWNTTYTVGTINYLPAGGWSWNDTVTVQVTAKDDASPPSASDNDMGTVTWSFQVVADTDGLQITNLSPADGATGVPRDTAIEFDVIDGAGESGVNPNSITLTVQCNAGTYNLTAGDLTLTDITNGYHVLWQPPQPFDWNETVQCTAYAEDNAGNNTGNVQWSFTTEQDTSAPVITAIDPTDGATNVPVNATLQVRVEDAGEGVNPASITFTIKHGATTLYSGAPDSVNPNTAGAPSVVASKQLPAGTPYDADITVDVYAEDTAGNNATLTYTFHTEPEPTYTVLGRVVLQGTTTGLAGVTVSLWYPGKDPATDPADETTLTDGNGYYFFHNIPAGSGYTVEPSLSGWQFTPAQRVFDVPSAFGDVELDAFEATQLTYSMSGHIETASGDPVENVAIQINGTTMAYTNASGDWQVDDLVPGDYTVRPVLAGYNFDPAQRSVTIVDADVTNVDFQAIPQTFTISGLITDEHGNRLEGVQVTVDGHVAVTGANGRYSIGGLSPGTYQVEVSKAGWVFEWIDGGVPNTGPRTVTVPPSRTDIDFTGYQYVERSYSAGVYFLSVPATPRDPSPTSVFGTNLVARWDPSASGWYVATVQPDAETLKVAPGRGFFVRFLDDVDLQVVGEPTPLTQPVDIAAAQGWNMLGNPFDATLQFSNIAAISGSIAPYGFVYEPFTGQYLLVSSTPGVNVARSYILPWEGVWIYSYTGISSVRLGPPSMGAQAQEAKLEADLGQGGWWLQVQAVAGTKRDTCCAVGVAQTGEIKIAKPPAVSGSVDVAVVDDAGQRLAVAVAPASAKQRYEWTLRVSTDLSNAEVALRLPDLSRLPRDMVVYLVDEATGRRVYMRTTPEYRFQVGEAGGSREFKLIVQPRTSAGLVVKVNAAQAAGRRVAVTYTASVECTVRAVVMNIAGRPVRVLADGKPAAAGVNTLVWDGCNATGTPVPPGLYLLRIEAVAEDGQRATAVTQVRIGH